MPDGEFVAVVVSANGLVVGLDLLARDRAAVLRDDPFLELDVRRLASRTNAITRVAIEPERR